MTGRTTASLRKAAARAAAFARRAAILTALAPCAAGAQTPPPSLVAPALKIAIVGAAAVVFDPKKDACSPVDMPDLPARAFRAADGTVSLFALHYEARALRGADLNAVRIDCASALDSGAREDPALYDGRRFLSATWTTDGRRVAALVHNEYHADHFPGRCARAGDLPCWWNSVLAFRSDDSGARFAPAQPLVVAAAPFRQEVEQGRHRGFFSPSNMFAKGPFVYAFVATTGWTGQPYGACLLRNADPLNAAGWRAFDGREFSIRWRDPYARGFAPPDGACAPIAPFVFPVGAVVRHEPSGQYVALWENPRAPEAFPVAGLYYATSRDLIEWSAPALLAPGASLNDACAGGANRDGAVNAYPSLLDPASPSRNFDVVGDQPFVYYTRIKLAGCDTGPRQLMRAPLRIEMRKR